MDLRTMQEDLPWTIPYSKTFETNKTIHADMQHALIHIVKSAGIIAGMIDDADHSEVWSGSNSILKKRTADFVMCALRIANTAPGGAFDLQEVVLQRMREVNGKVPMECKGTASAEGPHCDDCAKQMN